VHLPTADSEGDGQQEVDDGHRFGFGSYGALPFESGLWVWLLQIRHLSHVGQVKCVGTVGQAISRFLSG
jgi:hypothetical protein